jgi:hypothetical protein
MFARLMGLTTISPEELLGLVERRAVTAIDVNSRSSWLRAHVPGARTLDHARQSRCADCVLLLQPALPQSAARRPPRERIRLHGRPRHAGRHHRLDGREASDGSGRITRRRLALSCRY